MNPTTLLDPIDSSPRADGSAIVFAHGIGQRYRFDGPEHAPVLVLCNSLGTGLEMWDEMIPALAASLRVLRYDIRGHGGSADGDGDVAPAGIERFGRDLLGLMDALSIERAHVCGLSMGGLIAQWLAIHAPSRVRRLVLANTAARIGDGEHWRERGRRVRAEGLQWLLDSTPARWFRADYPRREPARAAQLLERLARQSPAGYAAACDAIGATDLSDRLGDLRAPTLCIAGRHDPVTTPADADALAAGIAGSRRLDLPTSHLSAVEAPQAFAAAVLDFLGAPAPGAHRHEDERYAQGMQLRRAVLGHAHVDRSLDGLNEHNREFQDLITRYAWGEIWARPGLPRHTRSLITVAMLVALNREGELRLHLDAARNNAVSREQLREVLLQTAIYCGVPAANAALHLAERVFAEQDAADSSHPRAASVQPDGVATPYTLKPPD